MTQTAVTQSPESTVEPSAATPVAEATQLRDRIWLPPFPARWHNVARDTAHFWTAYRPVTGSDPRGWSLLQYGTTRPTSPQGDVYGWAEGGYSVRFIPSSSGRYRIFTPYFTELLSRVQGAAWRLRTRAFVNVRRRGFFAQGFADLVRGSTSVPWVDVDLQAGVEYTVAAGAAIEIGVRDFKPTHYQAYAEAAGRLQFILADFRYATASAGAKEESSEAARDEAPESEILDQTEVSSEELAAQTRRELGVD